VLVLQRFLVVMTAVLLRTRVESSVFLSLIALCFLLVQLLARPYHKPWVNILQRLVSRLAW
jgi:hypothetical protein